MNTIRVSNSLDPDQARHFARLHPGPNYLLSYDQSKDFFSTFRNAVLVFPVGVFVDRMGNRGEYEYLQCTGEGAFGKFVAWSFISVTDYKPYHVLYPLKSYVSSML